MKKFTAILLVFSLMLGSLSVTAFATDVNSRSEQLLYRAVDKLLNTVVGGIAALIVDPGWQSKDKYVSENFYPGLEADEFIDEPTEGAVWSVGYDNASIQTGNELNGEHFVGGSLSITKKLATDIRDDQKVRTVAVSDGRGISIFACIDTYGLSNADVRGIRAKFEKETAAMGLDITSVNISTLHQHSCVDTLGLNGDLVEALFLSSVRSLFGKKLPNGQNKEFMENLYNKTVETMINAVNDMKPGKLYYGTVDVSKYIKDKRDPQVYDPNLNRLRFVPDDENAAETWIINGAIHCVGNGAAGTIITGDYPYYMEKYINETVGANYFYIQGAELALTSKDTDTLHADEALKEKYGDRYAGLAAFGKFLGESVCSITDEKEVTPILNIAYNEIFMPVDNNIIMLAAKGGLLTNKVVKTGLFSCEVVTEIGYAEFGTELAIAIIPGELAPEIAFGGATTAEESWDGKSWDHPSFSELAAGKKLLVFGLTNDQVGYILADNNWHSYLTENEEIVSTSTKAGSTIANAFEKLFKDCTAA